MPHDDDVKCTNLSDTTTAGSSSASAPTDSTPFATPLKPPGDLFHDLDDLGANGDEEKDVSYVMSRMLDHNTNPWEWSRCSRHFVTNFLE